MNASTNIQRKSSRRRTSSVLVTFVAALFAAIGLLLIAVERTDAQTQGEVWAWGGNELGALGDGTNTDRNTPVQVSDLSDVQAVAGGGAYSMALKNDGSVWAWGDNRFGQLGDGTTTNRNTPVQVSDLSGVQAVDGGELFSLALKDEGSVWAWGSNAVGQLGDGAFNQSNTPVQVSGLSGVQAIAAGESYSMALKDDGSVWVWGFPENSNTPVQVSGLSGVQDIAAGGIHSLAIGSFKVKATKEPIRQSLLVDFDLDDEACSGDLIHLTGKLNSVFHLVDDGAGGFHVNTEFNFANVEGTGEPSGGHYTVPTTARSTFYSHSDGFPIIVTETTSSTVIGQGQLPDSTAHQVIHFTIHENDTVTAEVIHFRSECK